MRNVIQKMQRLNQIRDVYAEQIKQLAKIQLGVHQKIIKEFKLDNGYDERNILRYDYLEIDSDGNIQLWERGRCGDSDEHLTTIYIDEHIVKNDLDGYEKSLRTKYARQAEQAEIAAKKQKDAQREKLKKEIVRLSEELGKIS